MKLSIHTPFAEKLAAKHDALFLDYGLEEQTGRIVVALERVGAVTTFAPVAGTSMQDITVDLAGFGLAPLVYVTEEKEYLLLSDVAEALGWPLCRAYAWAQLQHQFAIQDQRDHDEERGDGRLGWECLLDFIDLDLVLIEEDPEAKPDASGRRWSHSGDFLVSKIRLPLLLSASPWGKEFMDNSLAAFSHGMREVWGDKLKDIPTYSADGQPTGGNAYDDLFVTDGLTKEEAVKQAKRGPSLSSGWAHCSYPGCAEPKPHSEHFHNSDGAQDGASQ